MSNLLALIAACLYGAADFCGGLAVRRAPLLRVTALSQAVGLVALAVLAPLTSTWPGFGADIAWGAAAGLLGGSGVALLYLGLARSAASVVAPVSGVVALVLPVLAGLMIGERPSVLVWSGIAVAAGAVTLIGGGAPEAHIGRAGRGGALIIAIAAGVMIGGFLVCLGRTSSQSGMWPLLAARSVSTSLFLAGAAIASWRRPPSVAGSSSVIWLILGCGLLDMCANALYQRAVRGGELSVIATLTNLYPASTVVLAAMLLGERPRRVQWVGFGLALMAVVMINA
ncbi:MAG: DMT family transporter [Acidobacteriota bacterium]